MKDKIEVEYLHRYKMKKKEMIVWNSLCTKVRTNCCRMELPDGYAETINESISSSVPYAYERGYYKKNKTFYEISQGDRGALSLTLSTQSEECAIWYFTEQIASSVGLDLELKNRSQYTPLWRYHDKFDDANKCWRESPQGWKINLRYDGRIYWFEYTIRALSKIYKGERIDDYIETRIRYMNQWFDEAHWGFDKDRMCFIEISDSPEHD